MMAGGSTALARQAGTVPVVSLRRRALRGRRDGRSRVDSHDDDGPDAPAAVAGPGETGADLEMVPELDLEVAHDTDLDAGRSSIKRNVAHMLSSQLVTWSLALVLAIVQPRFLGPATQGRMRLAFSLWTIASVVIALGTSLYLNLETARRGRAALTLVGPIIVLRLLTFSAATVLFAVGAVIGGADREFVWILTLFGLTIALSTVSEVYSALFIGLERMAAPALVNIITRFFGTVAAVVVLFAGGGAIGVLVVAVVANVFGLALIVRAMHRVVDVPLHVGRSQWSTIVRGSVAFMVAGGVLTLYQQVDTVVIALFVEEEALGWYATADALFGTLLFLPTILCSTIFPTLGRLHEHDPEGLVSLVRRTFATLTLVAVPIGLGTVVVAHQAAPLLYGEKFRETGPVLAVLGVVLIVTAVTILLGTVAMATGRQRFWNTVMFAGVLMTVPLDLVLVPWADRTYDNGAIGGALAYVVTEVMMLTVGLWKIAPFLVDRHTMSRVARILLAGCLLVAAAWPTRGSVLVLPVSVGAVVFVVAVLALRVLSDEERSMIARVGQRLPLRRSSPFGGS